MGACSQAAAALQRPAPAPGRGSGSILQTGQRRGAPAGPHRGAAPETPRVGRRRAGSISQRSQADSVDFQVHVVDARLHGEPRDPEHQARVPLQQGRGLNFAIDAGHHAAAGPGVWKHEGCEQPNQRTDAQQL